MDNERDSKSRAIESFDRYPLAHHRLRLGRSDFPIATD